MSIFLSPYYLPVTLSVVEDFFLRGVAPDLVVECAAIWGLMFACRTGEADHGTLARTIADADRTFGSISKAEVASFLVERRGDVAFNGAAALEASLQAQAILFASDEQMASRAWCSGTGRYTDAFQEHCRNPLIEYEFAMAPNEWASDEVGGSAGDAPTRVKTRGTSDQVRTALAIAADPDEHYDLTAYAGTGKTHLIFTMAESGRRFTHLAPTWHQRHAFVLRLASTAIPTLTQQQLAQMMVADQFKLRASSRGRPPRVGESSVSPHRQAEIAEIPSIGGEQPVAVLTRILRAIRRWCHGDAPAISAENFLSQVPPTHLPSYVALAERVWALMFQPVTGETGGIFTLRLYHLVKWLDQAGAGIPPLGTILVDEAHDLQTPWRSLLNRYPGGWVIMGDPYQRLSSNVVSQSFKAKALTMVQSVRTGEHAMPLIRSVLDLHSERLVSETICGSREHITRHRMYERADELPPHGLRVYGTEWKLLEDALRLKDSGARFRLVPASAHQLEKSVTDAINLRRFGDVPREFHLRGFTSWDALAHHFNQIGQSKIARLFERDFSVSHFQQLLQAQADEASATLTLGMLEHCKSLEWSVVVMSECCFTSPANVAATKGRDLLVKAVYVSMTRVRDELWLPADAMDRLQNHVTSIRST